MGRRSKRQYQQSPGPYPCFFGCGRVLLTKFDPQIIEGWDWFTGYGDGPIHFCPQCRKTRQYEIDRIRGRLNVKPEGYPKVTASPYGDPHS